MWSCVQVKMIKTFVRTKSGRLKEKTVYVNKSDYDKIKAGGMEAKEMMKVLKKYVKTEDGEKIDGWGEAVTKQVCLLYSVYQSSQPAKFPSSN